uniref:Legionella vir region protein n=1 Tax=uncultured bacterium BLR12 TaxID=506514 RepID=C0INE4_9BACT|nr:Legionella vir region protein [uncultured bacterium BLR12]
MKKITLIIALCFCMIFSFAQHVPQGMKYQAVARNLSGNIIANQEIYLKIDLLTGQGSLSTIYYSEVHKVVTNQLGLFTLTIGEGNIEKGTFSSIPWSTADVWMQVAIKDKGKPGFVPISSSKLLAVPYAFHAETANALAGKNPAPPEIAASNAPENGNTDGCDCKEGLKALKVLYLGTNVDIKVYGDKQLKKLIFSFLGVKNGDVLNVEASQSDHKLPNSIYFKIQNTSIPVFEVPSDCNKAVIGETYGSFSIVSRTDAINRTCTVCDIKQVWKIGGNVVYDPCNFLGSKSKSDVVLITDNTERMRITTDGNVNITNNLNVGKNLNVIAVTPSTTPATGALIVKGGAGVGGDLNVGGKVNFGGASSFGGQLHITDLTQSTFTSTGALIVDGGTGIGKNLNVGGNTNVTGKTILLDSLKVSGGTTINNSLTVNKNDAGFVATINNSNDGDGDGLVIKLGKAKSSAAYSLPGFTAAELQEIADFKNLLRCDYPGGAGGKITLLGEIAAKGVIEDLKSIAGIAVGTGNIIIDFLNSSLSLPVSIGPYGTPPYKILNETTIFGGITMPPGIPDIPSIKIPELKIPALDVVPNFTVLPKIPEISIPGITPVNIFDVDFWGIPDICLTDGAGSLILNNANEFIRFSDKNDVKVGSVRGVSVTNWANNYLSPTFLFKLRGALLSSKVDKFHAQYHFRNEITTALLSYTSIGVEYSSGNGDYAEWLERMDNSEVIGAGDIVGVVGGKITKNLKGAEQVMVVSSNPIILGNMPAEGKNNNGNNIAFMGQVPVKIVGPVLTGDYIIGQSNTPGYGIAKHPDKMSIDDYKNAVGRSWATDESDEPKMINTVVGVHNNNFLTLIKELKEKTERNDARLKAIEAKLNMPVVPKSKMSTRKSLQ